MEHLRKGRVLRPFKEKLDYDVHLVDRSGIFRQFESFQLVVISREHLPEDPCVVHKNLTPVHHHRRNSDALIRRCRKELFASGLGRQEELVGTHGAENLSVGVLEAVNSSL